MALNSTLIAFLLLAAHAASAQSLGDVARAEEARRKAVKASGKVFTNDSLRPEPPPQASVPGAPASGPSGAAAAGKPDAAASGSTGAPGGASASGGPAADGGTVKDEAYWRKRLETERTALARAQTFAEALQSRINALSTDFINRDDPQQKNAIAADRLKALEELDRVRKEIEGHQTNITTIQDEARQAGVPAGWVR